MKNADRSADTPSTPRDHGSRGTALIEFALVLPFLLAVTFGVIDMSRAFWIKNTAHQAAREGVRYLVVHTVADSADARTRAIEVLAPAKVSMSEFTIVGPLDPGRRMEVTVGVQFNWLFPGLFSWLGATFDNPMNLQATCVMRKES